MSLQRRLTLFFVLIVILPLLAAGFIVQRVIVGEISRRAILSLRPALDATVAIYNREAEGLDRRVRTTVDDEPRFGRLFTDARREPLESFLNDRLEESMDIDFLLAVGPNDELVASATRTPGFLAGFQEPSMQDITGAEPGATQGFYRTAAIPIQLGNGEDVGHLVGGFWLDEDLRKSVV